MAELEAEVARESEGAAALRGELEEARGGLCGTSLSTCLLPTDSVAHRLSESSHTCVRL